MYNIIKSRILQGCRTLPFPVAQESLPERFRGLPSVGAKPCAKGCQKCLTACPVQAIHTDKVQIDLGRCIFCGQCVEICPQKKITFTRDYRLAGRTRDSLLVLEDQRPIMEPLQGEKYKLFHRSLKLRQVSAGGCNACEADINVLNTLAFDLGRFGIQFVASPRHADGLLVTGPVTQNMHKALLKTWKAVAAPKILIATGSCAISGGLFRDAAEVHNGVEGLLPVDLYIPGCPPNPWTILDGLVRLIGKV